MKNVCVKTFSVGHTFTMCDAFYGIIENKVYKKQIENQQQWNDIMALCDIDTINVLQEQFKEWMWLHDLFFANKLIFFKNFLKF